MKQEERQEEKTEGELEKRRAENCFSYFIKSVVHFSSPALREREREGEGETSGIVARRSRWRRYEY